jgi:type II secretory pathway pseudopilin PulG
MKRNIFTTNIYRIRGFTLIEALVSTFVITSVVLGPLSVALDASANARLTKDTMISTYLAQEAVELLRGQQDSLYLRCIQESGGACTLQNGETPSEAAWRLFKERLGSNNEGVSCFRDDNPAGCSYDFVDMTGDLDNNPTKYGSTSGSCDTLALGPDYFYVCTGIRGSAPGYMYKKFSRSVSITPLLTFVGPDSDYNDDLRATVKVSFARPNGFMKDTVFTDFLHARP